MFAIAVLRMLVTEQEISTATTQEGSQTQSKVDQEVPVNNLTEPSIVPTSSETSQQYLHYAQRRAATGVYVWIIFNLISMLEGCETLKI